jgi:hypothetical protein
MSGTKLNIFEALKWTTMNPLSDQTDLVSGDPRRGSSVRFLNKTLNHMYGKNCLVNTDEFYGIVVMQFRRDIGLINQPYTMLSPTPTENFTKSDDVNVYKVYIPELECRPFPIAFNDPILATYQDVHGVPGVAGSAPGDIVRVQYRDLGNMKNPRIVGKVGEVDSDFLPAHMAEGLSTQFDNGSPELIQNAQPFTGATPNADKLRDYLMEKGISEKGNQLSTGGDISPEIVNATIAVLDTLYAELPNVIIEVTAGNDLYHQNLADSISRHKRGDSVDFTVSPDTGTVTSQVEKVLQRYAAGNGGYFRYLNEYDKPSTYATGGHFHISWGVGTEAQAEVDAAVYLASLGTIEAIHV